MHANKKRMIYRRLMRNSIIDRRSGCYIYTGPVKDNGRCYGKISMRLPGRENPTGVSTHVLSFNTFVRAARVGYEVAHACNRSLCWNPDHLKEQKHTTNMREVSRMYAVRKAAKQHVHVTTR